MNAWLEAWGVAAGELLPMAGVPLGWACVSDGLTLTLEVVPSGPAVAAAVRVVVRFEAAWRGAWDDLSMTPMALVPTRRGQRLTGDAELDALVLIVTSKIDVHAVLDLETRAELADLAMRGVLVRGRELRLEPWASAGIPLAAVGDMLAALRRLAHRFADVRQGELVGRIMAIMRDDPQGAVRARLQELARESRPIADELALGGVDDDAVSDKAFARVSAIVGDVSLSASARVVALSRLLQVFSIERCAPVVEVAMRDLGRPVFDLLGAVVQRPVSDAWLLAELLVRWPVTDEDARTSLWTALLYLDVPAERLLARLWRGDPDASRKRAQAVSALPKLTVHGMRGHLLALFFADTLRDPYLAPEYIKAFERIGDARWAGTVATALTSPYDNLPPVAIKTLGAIGDLAVVSMLKPLTEGLFRGGTIKVLAREAIASIQERHGAVSNPGALSLVTGEAGGLSLDEPPRS